MIDLTSEFGIHVEKRLQEEGVIWLTTVASDGTPQPNPVWFYWDGESFLIYTKPDAAKLKNIARSPKVSLNLEGAAVDGGDVVVFNGTAVIKDHPPEPDPGYLAKYQEVTAQLGREFSDVYQEYSITLRIIPSKVRGF
jgi:PPOX class probable F420-dependent enzyme